MKWGEYFTYDPAGGFLVWAERPMSHFRTERGWRVFKSRFQGKRAGTPHIEGYEQVIITKPNSSERILMLSHRIIWEMHYGPIPQGMDIDHIDRNRSNNLISNLRLATRSQNLSNSVRDRGVNDMYGVHFDKRRKSKPYYSRIAVNGKHIFLGTFETAQEARDAYVAAAIKYHGEFAKF